MRLHILHHTIYDYECPVTDSQTEVRLAPCTDDEQTCISFSLETRPQARIFSYRLPTGQVHHFSFRRAHSQVIITAQSVVATYLNDPTARLQLVEDDRGAYFDPQIRQDYAEYLMPTPRVPLLPDVDGFAAAARDESGPGTASFLSALCRHLNSTIAYRPGVTTVESTLKETLDVRTGVCQDFTHLMLAVCRRGGIPARYVSGYLYAGQRNPDWERN
jgi:transglutaminase-like putative cysteine protease